MFDKIKSLLPRGWFPDSAPNVSMLLQAITVVMQNVYDLLIYIRLQTRIKTSTGAWLDLTAKDFFGLRIQRGVNQSDVSFRSRIIAELFRPRATRESVRRVLIELTGREPIIFEPARPADTGAYNLNCLGYNTVGAYGTLTLPYQSFVTAFRPSGSGLPLLAGYGSSTGAYNTPSRSSYGDLRDVIGAVTDSDIYAAVDSVRPVGTILWTQIRS